MSTVILTAGNHRVELRGDYTATGVALTSLAGWYETPEPKITVTERGQGDGAHDITASSIMYNQRTVTIGYRILADSSRVDALQQLTQLDKYTHQLVTARVVDAGQDTYVTGYYQRSIDQSIQNPAWQDITGTLTIVAARPERLAWTPYRVQLRAASTGDTGLQYGGKATGLSYPLSYGVRATDARNTAMLVNRGSSRAYPVLTVNGDFDAGVIIDFPGTGAYLRYTQPVGYTPLVLDSRSRTATVGGLDVTRYLSSRGFPVVEPYSSVSAVLLSGGSGWVTCEVRDTYM